MNIFTKKSFMKKMAILCLFLVLFNFSGINQVQASDDGSEWGGKLISPIISLFVSIADGVYSVVTRAIMGNDSSILTHIKTDTGFWEKVWIRICSCSSNSCRCIDWYNLGSTNCSCCRTCGSYNCRAVY